MDLKLWDIKKKNLKPRASIHSVGKLGFNMDASIFMNLNLFPSFVFATIPDDRTLDKIFLIETSSMLESGIEPVKVVRSGEYYNINTKNVLDQIGIDYRNQTSVYGIEISAEEYESCRVYILTREISKPRKNRTDEDSHA